MTMGCGGGVAGEVVAERLIRLRNSINPKYADRAGGGPQFRSYLAKESCFAGAVGTEDGDYLAAPHFQIDPAISFSSVAVMLDQVAH